MMIFETKFQEIMQRTHDVTSFRFPRPVELDYKPGQFCFVTLRQGDKELKKHFSFSSSPTEKDHIEFTKKFTDHEYSLALKAVKIGDWARIEAPFGKFTFEGEYPKIALLGGGIGITPFMSYCKNATDKNPKQQDHAVLWLPHARRHSFQEGVRGVSGKKQEPQVSSHC